MTRSVVPPVRISASLEELENLVRELAASKDWYCHEDKKKDVCMLCRAEASYEEVLEHSRDCPIAKAREMIAR